MSRNDGLHLARTGRLSFLYRQRYGDELNHHVHIDEISPMEKELLEKIFGQINQLRKQLSQVGQSVIYF